MIHLKTFILSVTNLTKPYIQKSKFGYSFNSKKNADAVLKQYFSHRLGISTSQLQNFIIQLSKCENFNKKDDRWGNLCLTIQRNLTSFDLRSKIAILLVKGLAKVKQNNQLFVSLLRQIIANIDFLSFEELSKVTWSLTKTQSLQKATILLIYKRIVHFLNQDKNNQGIIQNDQQQKTFRTNISITKKELSILQKDKFAEQNKSLIHISGKNYILLIWSFMKSKIVDKKIITKLAKIATKQTNILNIQIQDQCLLLHCLTNLQMEKLRATKHLTQNIMLKHKQVQGLNMLSLVLLIQSFSHYIFQRQTMILDNDNDNQVRSLKEQIEKNKLFVLFVLETITLRHNKQERISYKFGSILIFHLAKINLYESNLWKKLLDDFTYDIDQATVQDLTMTIQGISRLQSPIREQIKIYEQNICKRIWQIYNSIYGKSLNVIQQLIKNKQIFPPPRIVKQIRKNSQIRKHQLNNQTMQKKKKKRQQFLSQDDRQELSSVDNESQKNEFLKKSIKFKDENIQKQRQNTYKQQYSSLKRQDQDQKSSLNTPSPKKYKKYTKVEKN